MKHNQAINPDAPSLLMVLKRANHGQDELQPRHKAE